MSTKNIYKVIVSGPVGAGKTTAISAVSDIAPVATEVHPTDETRLHKLNTTVAMDYGVVRLDGHHKIHLYGTPGQKRFDFMWDILSQGGTGLILLLDSTRSDLFADLKLYIGAFSELLEKQKLAIGVTRMDMNPNTGLNQYRRYLEQLEITAPLFEVDARSRRDITFLLRALLTCEETT